MGDKLKNIDVVYDILNVYDGPNGYIRKLKNDVYKNNKQLNSFHVNFVLKNKDTNSRFIGKNVKIADWWALKAKDKYLLPFTPKVMEIGYYFGECDDLHVFYARFRKSQERGILIVCPGSALITNFWFDDFHALKVDFSKYNTKERTLLPIQEEAVKFLVSRKKGILANEQGSGKSAATVVASLEGGYKHILIVCPASIKNTWVKELSYFVDENDIVVVNGNNWQDKKYTIINYDILDNFYTIPKQTIKQKTVSLTEKGEVVTTYNSKEMKAKNKAIIQEAMSKSQLFQAEYDLIIIDEAHKLSNNTSGRFQIMEDLIKRSKPKGIFELTGTMITNSSKNLYNLLKIIDVPITKDWNRYMERYCSMKSHYQKGERDAYTSIFLKNKKKRTWYDLTDTEKDELNEFLEKKHCKKFYVHGDDANMEELREIIKPYYLRRLKSDFTNMVKKTIKCIHYEMNDAEKEEYNKLWEKYLSKFDNVDDIEKIESNKQLIEISLMRQWLADRMIKKTTYLVKKCVELGHKVVVFCAYDNEIDKLRKEFKDYCVYHNGKLTLKKKDEAVDKFQNDENVKVFIGNITSSSVGITLTAGDVAVFNNFSFTEAENSQAEDRIYRIGQNKPCTIYYQSFNGTYFDRMLEIVNKKREITNKIVARESEK